MLIFIFSLLGLKLVLGACPSMSVMYDFDIDEYLGLWYQRYVFSSNDSLKELLVKCVSAEYYKEGNNYLLVYDAIDFKDNQWISYKGQLRFAKEADTQKKEAKLQEVISDTTKPHWVLHTDYNTYAVVYSCQNDVDMYYRVWILIRDLFPKTSEEERLFRENIKKILGDHQIPSTRFINVDQKTCFT